MTNHLRTQLFRAKLPVVSSCNSSTQQLEDLPLVRRLQGLAGKKNLGFKSNKSSWPIPLQLLFSVPFCNVEVGWEDSYLWCLTLKNEFSQEDSNFEFLMRATIGNATIKTVSKFGPAAQSSKIREVHSKPNALLVSTQTHLYKGWKLKKKKGLNKTLIFVFYIYF